LNADPASGIKHPRFQCLTIREYQGQCPRAPDHALRNRGLYLDPAIELDCDRAFVLPQQEVIRYGRKNNVCADV
jgi:hypothetical protein